MVDYINRDTGHFPVSIGTSLAFEGLFGIHENQPPFPRGLNQVSLVLVNLRTLVRNFHSAQTTEEFDRTHEDVVKASEMINDELQVIAQILDENEGGRYQPIFYLNDLKNLTETLPIARFKYPTTERQIQRATFENRVVATLSDALARELLEGPRVLAITNNRCPMMSESALILTHHPHELLWEYRFDGLMLLESHTGRIKPPSQWPSKLKNTLKCERLPFNEITLCLFGEGTLLKDFPQAVRKDVIAVATERKWSVTTTRMKMVHDLARYGKTHVGQLTRAMI